MKRYMWGQEKVIGCVAAVACGALASACMAEGTPPEVDSDGSGDFQSREAGSLAEKLGEVAPLGVAGSDGDSRGSLIQVEASRSDEDIGTSSLSELELEVLGGYIDVRSLDDDRVAIRDLAIDIADLTLPEGVVSADVRFTGVQARIAQPETFEMAWGEGGERAEAVVSLDFLVDWAVSVDGGEMHPLAPVEIEDLEVVLELSWDEEGEVAAQLAGFRDGVFYEWGGMVELRALSVDLRAEEARR